jgi:hypothetical protein
MQFKDLRENNVKRSETSFYAVDSWSPTDWATALAGEVGECPILVNS